MATVPVTIYGQGGFDPEAPEANVIEVRQEAVTDEYANRDTLHEQALAAMQRNRALIADPSVTNAEAVAAVKGHARQLNGIIRLLLNQLDATD